MQIMVQLKISKFQLKEFGWFKDVDFDGDKVWEYFHMNN